MNTRRLAVNWLYAAAGVHIAVGVLLTVAADASVFDAYHRSVEVSFWPDGSPAAAREQQVWWIRLFGATIQSMSIWMAALVWAGDLTRRSAIWWALLAGLLIWAPQDIWLSAVRGAWVHVAVDAFALASMGPAMVWLVWVDRARRPA